MLVNPSNARPVPFCRQQREDAIDHCPDKGIAIENKPEQDNADTNGEPELHKGSLSAVYADETEFHISWKSVGVFHCLSFLGKRNILIRRERRTGDTRTYIRAGLTLSVPFSDAAPHELYDIRYLISDI
jgi:hypothetical protein